MTQRLLLSLALALACPAMTMAQAATFACDDKDRITRTLTEVLGAERQGLGLRDPETVVEVWVTPRNGDWMIVQNNVNGTACIIAMGAHWQNMRPDPA